MAQRNLIHQLFIGKVVSEIGKERALELLIESREAFEVNEQTLIREKKNELISMLDSYEQFKKANWFESSTINVEKILILKFASDWMERSKYELL